MPRRLPVRGCSNMTAITIALAYSPPGAVDVSTLGGLLGACAGEVSCVVVELHGTPWPPPRCRSARLQALEPLRNEVLLRMGCRCDWGHSYLPYTPGQRLRAGDRKFERPPGLRSSVTASTRQRMSVEVSRCPTLRALRFTDPTHGRWVLGPALAGPPALVRTSVPALLACC